MRIGALRHRVSLQKLEHVQNQTTGEMGESWVQVKKLYARVEPLSAREFIAAQQENSEVSARITIRYRNDIKPGMRFVHRGNIYDIQGHLPDNHSGLDYITLPVKQGASEAGNV